MRLRFPVAVSLFLPLAAAAAPAADVSQGKALHDKLCMGCHVKMVGGDGSALYMRKDRMIHSLDQLRQRVTFCATQINAGLFPEDEAKVVAYLNAQFYKFK